MKITEDTNCKMISIDMTVTWSTTENCCCCLMCTYIRCICAKGL